VSSVGQPLPAEIQRESFARGLVFVEDGLDVVFGGGRRGGEVFGEVALLAVAETVGCLKRASLLKEYSCFEEDVFSGDRLIWRAVDTESRQNDERISIKLNNHHPYNYYFHPLTYPHNHQS
jgi:hypothetical protein